jgi:hypothetical protein
MCCRRRCAPSTSERAGAAAAAALAALLAAWPAAAAQRTETRQPCTQFDPLRNVYFGDTHVHTALSFDASALGVRATPRDAYRFARGEALGLRPYDDAGNGRRQARLARPLDFAVVTDHAELLGETRICAAPEAPGHHALICRVARRWPLLAYVLVNGRMLNVADPVRYDFCGPAGADCRAAALAPWREIQEAAEEAYDRTSACRFTTFVGYEWSGNPDSNMIHRNVIFRNAAVPDYPTSYVDDPRPEGLWEALRRDCLARANGCDVLAIPHNSNLSGGRLFAVAGPEGPLDRATAARRAALEPLVEVLQHKGDSECRVAPTAADELCGFEKLPFATMDRQPFPFRWGPAPPRSFVREILGEGLVQLARLGANPFKVGLLAATDTHQGTPGLVDERDFAGHAAGGDTAALAVPEIPDALEFNPGGLTAVWAEENSRDALFEAMRRREVYGTSGPRIAVRFFGGWQLGADPCASHTFVADGYRRGVPMGGDLPAPGSTDGAPEFAVWALADPGTADRPGAPLQRVEVIKIWLADGTPRERVVEVAGAPRGAATVDPRTCAPSGPGVASLCATWRDPEFDPAAPALYYARVVESPTCRWSTWVCNARGVDCARPAIVPAELAGCCADTPRTVQERAWTSPIWYTPAALASARP